MADVLRPLKLVVRWFRRPRGDLPSWQRRLRTPLDYGWRAGKSLWFRENGSSVADALAFRTVFSLLPMLVVMLSIVQAFRGVDSLGGEFADDVIDFVLPTKLQGASGAPEAGDGGADLPGAAGSPGAVEDGAEQPGAAGIPSDTGESAEQAREEYQAARREMGERIRSLLDALGQVDFGGLGAIGLLLFIYGATGLLGIIEGAFNRILQIEHDRPIGRRLVLYYTIITLGPLVMAAGQVVRGKVIGVVTADVWGGWTNWLLGPIALLTPLLTTFVVFIAMFLLLPSRRVPFGPAAMGALVASVLWMIGRELFGLYAGTTAISSVYGAVALVPVFLLWIWLSWLIILFGLEIADTIIRVRANGWDEATPTDEPRLVEPAWLVPLAVRVAAAFERGETCSTEALARGIGAPERPVRRALDAFVDAALLRRQPASDETVCYTLARPADRITIRELLDVGRERLTFAVSSDVPKPAGALLERLRAVEREAAEGTTLRDLLEDGGDPA